MQGALLIIGRTAKGQACGPVTLHDFVQLPHQTGFANARLAAEQHHLPVPFLDLGPASLQQPYLLRPPYQGCQATRDGRFEATRRRAGPQDLVDRQGLVQPFERGGAQCLTSEQTLHELLRGSADDHRVGGGQALQPGGQVGRLAQRQALGPVAATHLAHHHQPGMDAHPHSQAYAMVAHQVRVPGADGLDNPQAGMHGPRGIVFMRLRIAKIHQQPVTEILRNMSGKALDDCRTGGLVGVDDLAQVFRVEPPSQRVESARSQNSTVS